MIRAVVPSLEQIREKVEAGERLDAAEAESLWDERIGLHDLGVLANIVRERKHGNVAYYNINTHLNPTNVCVYRCTFCAFRADLREARGYVMSDEQILARGQRPSMRARPRCTSSAAFTTRRTTTGIST